MNGYKAFYNGRTADIWALSALDAQQHAVAYFKPPKSKRHMVHVVLAERDGQPVVHSTTEF